ncbi:F-box domain-containing protein [Artemisia annua]|uniref:F-box domain-containing protein n=1 Tax=Artemisia annua TaxID=35608 RepID=A0A2U1P5K5_ARTAN|nr:F-box domain-containing protein [Artemisia annua]
MDGIPTNIMFHILSRCPVKSLLCFRCVSKLWCKYIDDIYLAIIHDKRGIEEPTPIMFHLNPLPGRRPRSLCFHTIDHQSSATNTLVMMKPKEVPDFEFLCKKPRSKSSITNIEFLGSCNGLIYVSESDGDLVTTLSVIHPIKKQCYELPHLPFRFSCFMSRESCGLCFDSSTNTLKMVCVLLNGHPPSENPEEVRKNLYTMVHVFGTKSWQKIPQVPSYPIQGEAIFANGCLHWLVSYHDSPKSPSKDKRHVVWFDVKKEEFGSIDPPETTSNRPNRKYGNWSCDHLVNLNGQVGYFCNRTTEVWVLNHKNEWVLHCHIDDKHFSYGYIKVFGCLNKDGDVLIRFKKINEKTSCSSFTTSKMAFYMNHTSLVEKMDIKQTLLCFPIACFHSMTS